MGDFEIPNHGAARSAGPLGDHRAHDFQFSKTEESIARFQHAFEPRIGNNRCAAIQRQDIDVLFRQSGFVDRFSDEFRSFRNGNFN